MKYGERVEIMVERLDEKGRGSGPVLSNKPEVKSQRWVTARGTIPGERVAGNFSGKDKGVIRLSDVEILTASPDRVKPECPHFGTCGGCSLQHIVYKRQAELKLEFVRRVFSDAKLAIAPEGITVADTTYRHRNRMDFVFGHGGELGLKEPGRWDRPVDLTTCLMLSEDANRVRLIVRDWARGTKLPFWDNKAYVGFFRYLVIRESVRTNERMATLVTSAGEIPEAHKKSLVEKLAPLCTTIYHGINPKITDLSIAEELHLLHGKDRLHETVAGVTFAIHPNSFFQTNTAMAEKLLLHVRDLVVKGQTSNIKCLLDLYCGSGFFSLTLAKDVEKSLGIELDAHGIAMAKENAAANGITNTKFRAELAEALTWLAEKPDVAIVDPPRSGLHPKVVGALLAGHPPRIIYVSCNPRALALDLKFLLKDYDATSVQAFDLFPQTPHVETVVHLKLKHL